MDNIYDLLEKEVLPCYYNKPEEWNKVVDKSMTDVNAYFGSDRMADEYYTKLYSV